MRTPSARAVTAVFPFGWNRTVTRTTPILCRLTLAIATVWPSGVAVGGELEDEAALLVTKLRDRLSEPDEEQFEVIQRQSPLEITERLREIGPEARLAVPLLVQLLDKDDGWAAARALEGIGGEAVPHMTTALRHEKAAVRRQLCESLCKMGLNARSAVPAVIQLVERETDPTVRDWAIRALGRTGHRSEAALAALTDALDNEATAAAAADALRRFDIDAEVSIDAILRATKHESPIARRSALQCLAQFDRDGKRSAPVLANALADHGRVYDCIGFTVSMDAASKLVTLKAKAAPAVPVIAEMMKAGEINEGRSIVFKAAARLLCLDPKSAGAAIPALRRAAKRDLHADGKSDWFNAEIRVAAACCLCIIEGNKEAYGILIEMLDDERWRRPPEDLGKFGGLTFSDPRPEAAAALGRLGSRAKSAVPLLRKVLKEGLEREQNDLAAEAGWALARIDATDKTCVPGVIKKTARGALWREPLSPGEVASILGSNAEACADNLIDSLFHWTDVSHNPANRRESDFLLRVLLEIEPDPVPRIIERSMGCLQGKHEHYDAACGIDILHALGAEAADAIPQLMKDLKDASPSARANSAEALGRIGQRPEKVLPALVAALGDSRALVRARAAESIGAFGADAKSYLGSLRRVLNDDYLIVRSAASRAIQEIECSQVPGSKR